MLTGVPEPNPPLVVCVLDAELIAIGIGQHDLAGGVLPTVVDYLRTETQGPLHLLSA